MLSLFSQSIGFNPAQGFFGQNYRNLLVYRQAGLEFVDIVNKETDALDGLGQQLADARLAEFKRLLRPKRAQGKTEDQATGRCQHRPRRTLMPTRASSAGSTATSAIISNLSDTAKSTKAAIKIAEDKKAEKQLYLDAGKRTWPTRSSYQDVDLAAAVKPLKDALPSIAGCEHQVRRRAPPP